MHSVKSAVHGESWLGITNKAEKKRACEAYLVQMEAQRATQKKSRSSIEDTDDILRFLKAEIEHLSTK